MRFKKNQTFNIYLCPVFKTKYKAKTKQQKIKYKTQLQYITASVFAHRKEGQSQIQQGTIQRLIKLSFKKNDITNFSSEIAFANLSKSTQLNRRSTLKSQNDR